MTTAISLCITLLLCPDPKEGLYGWRHVHESTSWTVAIQKQRHDIWTVVGYDHIHLEVKTATIVRCDAFTLIEYSEAQGRHLRFREVRVWTWDHARGVYHSRSHGTKVMSWRDELITRRP